MIHDDWPRPGGADAQDAIVYDLVTSFKAEINAETARQYKEMERKNRR